MMRINILLSDVTIITVLDAFIVVKIHYGTYQTFTFSVFFTK